MQKITLVNYPYVSSVVKYPLGLLNLKHILDNGQEGFTTNVVDFNRLINEKALSTVDFKSKNYPLICGYILDNDPDMVGFSTIAMSLDIVLEMAEYIKKIKPEVTIFLGGPAATVVCDRILTSFPSIDLIFLGESETCIEPVLTAQINKLPYAHVKSNIAYRYNGAICYQYNAPPVELDGLPFLDLHQYGNLGEIDIEVGRGCPFNCYFCATSIYWRRHYSLKSPYRIVKELMHYIDTTGIRKFNFIHDLFTFKRDFVTSVCDEILRAGIEIEWSCSARIDCLDEQLLNHMKSAGCSSIFIGIESASERMQTVMRKHLNLAHAIETLHLIKAIGIDVTTSFVYGFPEETEEDLKKTISLIQEIINNFNFRVLISKCTYYPDTDVFLLHKERINTFSPTGDYLSLHSPNTIPEIINANRDLFPCFYSLDDQDQHQCLDVFINFYIKLIQKAMPNVYIVLLEHFDFLQMYYAFYDLWIKIEQVSNKLYEKSISFEAFFSEFVCLFESAVLKNTSLPSSLIEALYFDKEFLHVSAEQKTNMEGEL
ncbi:MAG: radical SAM protein [Eubacteriales bacterium]|nr:radical SAM protein [Eubacteriales bacterium]